MPDGLTSAKRQPSRSGTDRRSPTAARGAGAAWTSEVPARTTGVAVPAISTDLRVTVMTGLPLRQGSEVLTTARDPTDSDGVTLWTVKTAAGLFCPSRHIGRKT